MKTPSILMAVLAAIAAGPFQTQAIAMDHGQAMDHGSMGSGGMAAEASGATRGYGVINSVDTDARSVNITHDPIPALSWPAMTMDLPVTEAVDLDGVGSGDKVDFGLVLGEDNVYRISQLKKTE